MKKQLLLFISLALFAVTANAQTTAYQAPDLHQCNNEVFDLTVQNPIVLGNQDPVNFMITYYLTEEDAMAATNPLANPQVFTAQTEQQIFVRVSSITDDSFDISSFMVGWGFATVPAMSDVSACNSYVLPALSVGNYFTAPGGTGTMLNAGEAITETTQLYVYTQNNECSDEQSFTVTIGSLQVPEIEPLYACDTDGDGFTEFNLSEITEALYNSSWQTYTDVAVFATEADAQNNANPLPDNFTNTVPGQQTLYIRAENGDCSGIQQFTIIAEPCTNSSLSGTITYDSNFNGSDESDLPAAGVGVICMNNGNMLYTVTDSQGNYIFNNVPDGVNVITVFQLDGNAVSVPANNTITTPAIVTGLDFYIEYPNMVNDVNVTIIPTNSAVPGMQAGYLITYQNLGTIPEDGYITFTYDNNALTYAGSVPAMQQIGTSLSYHYTNLAPYGSGFIYVWFDVLTPPDVAMGDILTFTAYNDISVDDNPANNSAELNQVVVSSYDPNSITVREGEYITLDQASDYLYYTIHFQNEGTANAQNIHIDMQLDANLDADTFEPIAASHNFETERNDGTIAFMFDGINLPYASADEEGSNGWVTYRVKPVASIATGDAMSANADIYFDFNDAVPTNTVTTTVQSTAGLADAANTGFSLYPNPANDVVTLQLNGQESRAEVTVTDVLGKNVMKEMVMENRSSLNISGLGKGMYFVTVRTGTKTSVQKLMVN